MQRESARLGRYRLIERLAAGGMAEVYLARMQTGGGLEKTVVVKTILPELTGSEELRAMMLDEARIGFALRHQNIVQVLDVGREGNIVYVAMEHIDGLDLKRLQSMCEKTGEPLDPLLVAFIGVEVLRALDYAHRRRDEDSRPLAIVHRDISPHNVLLSIEGEVKLTDFGIARARDRLSKTATGGTKGKLAYMAPEQAAAGAIDARTDLFGVAATLYEALCGEPPFAGASDLEVLTRVQRGDVVALAKRRPDLDPLLSGVIDCALAADPAARPATAAAMRQPLEEVLRGQATGADQLGDRVRRARDAAHVDPDQQRFARAILGTDGTGTGLAGGTPTDPRLTRPAAGPGVTAPTADTLTLTGAPMRGRWLTVTLALGLAAAVGGLVTLVLVRDRPVVPGPATPAVPAVAPVTADEEPSTASASEAPRPAAQPAAAQPAAVPSPAPARSPTSTPAATRESPPARSRPRADRPPEKSGTLSVHSVPWAKVSIDGKYVGDTPLGKHTLRPGKHEVRLHNPETGQTRVQIVDVAPGADERLSLKL
jgi:hypothetical protein